MSPPSLMSSSTALVALLLALLHICPQPATAHAARQAISPFPSLTVLPTATATATSSTTQTQTATPTPTRTPVLTPSSSKPAPSQTPPPVRSTPRAPPSPDVDEEEPLITPGAEPSEGPSDNDTVGYVVAAIVLVVIVLGALFAIYGINLTSAAPPDTYTPAAGTGGVPEAVGVSPVQVSP